MKYTICRHSEPEEWEKEYYLECQHSYNRRAKTHFVMYCNLIKEMPDKERYKVRVFGYRWLSTNGSKIRYVPKERVLPISEFTK